MTPIQKTTTAIIRHSKHIMAFPMSQCASSSEERMTTYQGGWCTFVTVYLLGSQCRGHRTRHPAPGLIQASLACLNHVSQKPSADRTSTCSVRRRKHPVHSELSATVVMYNYLFNRPGCNLFHDRGFSMPTPASR